MTTKLADPLVAGQELFDVFPQDSAPRKYLQWSRKAFGSPHIYHLASILVCLAHELDYRGFYLTRGIDGGRLPITLWFLLLGGSASGKSTVIEATQDFWREAWKLASLHRPDPWVEPEGSPQGLVAALQELYNHTEDRTSAIFVQTEGAKVFNTREAIAEMLCKIYDGRTFHVNYRHNQKRKSDRVRSPHVSLLMASTEEQLAPYFKDQHRNGGIFTRFCWLNPRFTRKDIRMADDFTGATRLVQERREALEAAVFWFAQLSQLRKVRQVDPGFALTRQAHLKLQQDLFKPFRDAFEEGDTDNMHGVRMRLLEKAKVLAAILASVRGTMHIGEEDVENAIFLTKILLAHTQATANFGSDDVHRHALKLEQVIRATGDKGLGRRDFYRYIRINKKMMDQVVETLQDRGKIYQLHDRHRTGLFVHASSRTGKEIVKRQEERRTAESEAERLRDRRNLS